MLALALATVACVCRPAPEDWLAAGASPFTTPAAAFRTFKTAVGGDAVDLEYRCFSSAFRRREGMSQAVYREFRERLLNEKPWLRRISCSQVVGEVQRDARHAEIVGEVGALFGTTRFRIGFVREDFYDLYAGSEPVGGEVVEQLDDVVRTVRSASGIDGVALWLPLPPERTADDLSRIVVGQEWKIDSFQALEEDD